MARREDSSGQVRTALAAFVVTLALGVLLMTMIGCESRPTAPSATNPFDPDSPAGGDPLQVSASQRDSVIALQWNQPQGFGISLYEISHSDNPDSNWEFVEEVEHTTSPIGVFDYKSPRPTTTHWFRLQARNNAGDFTLTAYATPAAATIGPWVRVGAKYGQIATRYPEVLVRVTSGDSIRIALDPLFVDTLRVVGAGMPGDTVRVPIDLGPASDNGDTVTVYAQSFTGADTSYSTAAPQEIKFRPAFKVVGAAATVATRLIDLFVPTEGVVRMRFANSQADLGGAAWMAAADTVRDYMLTDSANRQTVWGEFEGDFGFVTDPAVTLLVSPDLLDEAVFSVRLGSDRITDQLSVTADSRAVATHMRIAETADFTSVPWVAYADSTEITLSPGEGRKTLYAQYRNDWVESNILTDYAIYVSQPAEVRFLAPREGEAVIGGRTLQVRGLGSAGSGTASVDTVRFDAGDGLGFRDVDGLEEWTYDWDVPSYVADTPLVLRARAWVGDDVVTAAINVTVTQLAVVIDAPVEGAQLTGDTEITISGRSASLLNGTSIERIEVEISGDVNAEVIEATGTDTWTATWTTQTVTAILDAVITARAYAGEDMVTDVINVTVAP